MVVGVTEVLGPELDVEQALRLKSPMKTAIIERFMVILMYMLIC